MALPIEDYALIGDTHTAALVGKDGSIDWLCLPRFDSGACFAALLGTRDHGRWLLAPRGDVRSVRRRYRPDTLVLETEMDTADGTVRIVDCMPLRGDWPDVVRVVEGVRGRVPMQLEIVVRFDYGSIVPWAQATDEGVRFIGGPDALQLRSPVALQGKDLTTVAEFVVAEGDRVPFVLTWYASHGPRPWDVDALSAVADTQTWWEEWTRRGQVDCEAEDAVKRSLITLKALTYAPTGGIVAAPTTSLPEDLGGERNWDYRFCWLRDATFTLYALMLAGYDGEAAAWRDWLLRAVAGQPEAMQIMYGAAGERRLPEFEVPWLPGYEGSAPVRIGNGAAVQFQLDVYGEVMDALHQSRRRGIAASEAADGLQRSLLEFVESAWVRPDEGIWEVRGPRRHFTHSKMMAWVAVDRGIKAVESFGLEGPVDRWKALADRIHTEVCDQGYDADRRTFTQYYGSKELDASVLMAPLVGFLPAGDERVLGTLAAVERELLVDGFVMRYSPSDSGPVHDVDGLRGGEGAFLPCSFWLADNYCLAGRRDDANALFDRLLALRNDVGLLSEEYDPVRGRLVGNFPQAFSHVALVNTAHNLSPAAGPAEHRASP